MASSSSPEDKVKAVLKRLRDTPAPVATEQDLKLLTDHILGPPPKQLISVVAQRFDHWFCSRATEVTTETAKFLIRLHAYSTVPRVKLWRQQLQNCLGQCCECVRGLQEAKITSRQTYFGAFSDDTLKGFYADFDNWELEFVLAGLLAAQLAPEAMIDSGHTLSDAPPAVVYHIFSNLHVLQDPRIVQIIQSHVPKAPISTWPSDFPPPGLFYALLHEREEVRNWAHGQLNLCKTAPMPKENFMPVYCTALRAITAVVCSQAVRPPDSSIPFTLARDASVLWSGFSTALRFVPTQFFRPGAHFDLDLCHEVAGHLHDTGNHFIEVLKCYHLILGRIGPAVWDGEGLEYPQVVFNSIKDNPRYLEALQKLTAPRRDSWLLSWIETYLKNVGDSPIFKEVLPIVVHFLCEELQHERFKELRPAAMAIAARVLIAVFNQAEKETPNFQHDLVWDIMDVHANMFVAIAFGRVYSDEKWAEARSLTRKFLKSSLVKDIKEISTAISILSGSAAPQSESWSLTVREQIWKEVYDSIQPGDSEGIALMVSTLSAVAHVDDLRESSFVERFEVSKRREFLKALLGNINRTLGVVRSGFADSITRYLDMSLPSAVADLFRKPEVVRTVTILMLSPVEVIQETAQALVGSAFDVEVRLDCFRALMEKSPESALAGVFNSLETYVQYAFVVPEACSLSKALARCLTDVIDVLCSSPDGLLLNQQFLKDGPGAAIPSQLPKWWNLMTKALSVIFLKTPKWAIYFDNAEMVLWMRDALIFGRDMLAQRRVIESGALAHSQRSAEGTNTRLSRAGKKMVDDLQPVLLEATRWLRLTDEELLHQSFALLESLLACFKENEIRPKAESLQKLQKHIDDARKKDPRRPQTRLDASRLAKLQDAISAFDEDDEIQIISHKIPERQRKSTSSGAEAISSKGKLRSGADLRKPTPMDQRHSKVTAKAGPSAKTNIASYFAAGDKKGELKSTELRSSTDAKPAQWPSSGASRPQVVVKDERGPTRPVASESSSSSEQEDSDEDGGGAGLASLAKLQRTPTVKKPAERRQVMLLDVPTKVRNPALDRMQKREDARRTQLRLKPDITALHRTLLSWNYDHEGLNPPGEPIVLTAVPDTFIDFQHFRRVFEPMLLLECWTQLVESKEGSLETYECRISSRQFVDDWIDLDISISESVKKDWNLSDADVVLLRHPSSRKCILGKAQSYRATPFGIQTTIRCYARGSDPGLQANSVWLVSKVLSLTTLHREYAALMALPYYDLFDNILQAKLMKPTVMDVNEVQRTMSTYNVNEPQARAILYSLKTEGFALIQGPPGTGKTSTICGLVHAFLSQRPKPTTLIHAGRNGGPADKEPVKKVLLCAPSNAAIDEIAYRLKEGVSGAGRRNVTPNVVRVGNVGSMNVSARDISLEHLIEQKLNANPNLTNAKDAGSEITRLRADLESVKRLRQQKLEEISQIHDNTAKTMALEEEIKKLNKQKVMLTHQFDKLKDKQKSDSRTLDATRRKFRAEVLLEADVICSTLSGSAYEYLEQFDFELIVIDEAAQAIELSSLIPLKYRCSRCVMVGDPQQLPPTVKSQEACNYGYNQSFFVRLQRQRPDAVHLLSIQYRMHPDISQVPSRLFYQGRLQDGPDVAMKTARPWHSNEKLGTYKFYNVPSGREETGNRHSFINRAECKVAIALYNRLRREFSSFDFDFKVGIISMYRGQIVELRRAFEQHFGQAISGTVDFNTVDGFQGQEKDVIILSCVRAGPNVQSVGFLRDTRRMNVALTRAKSSLFLLGHAPTLERSDETWRNIVSDARTRSCLVDVDVSYFTSPVTNSKVIVPTVKASKPSKPHSKAQSTNIPPIPEGLVPPRELKSSVVASTSGLSKPATEDFRKSKAVATQEEPSVSKEAKTGQKRPAPPDDTIGTVQSRDALQESGQAKPKPPPKKRPKQAPNLFIPKNKRPPH